MTQKTELVESLLAGVSSPAARVKFGASKNLRAMSEESPDLVYPHFDFFVRLLAHENSILKWNATLTLSSSVLIS